MLGRHHELPRVDRGRLSAVSVLADEHEVILRGLLCLERIAEEAAARKAIPIPDASQALEFLRVYADSLHQGKEEDLLFPAVERILPGFGPTRVIREEHAEAKRLLRSMGKALSRLSAVEFARDARAYAELLRSEIFREDEVLFRIVQALLPGDADAALVEAYRLFDASVLPAVERERIMGVLSSLEWTWVAAEKVESTPAPSLSEATSASSPRVFR
jgi:hemerythrin-like domain-containing protein